MAVRQEWPDVIRRFVEQQSTVPYPQEDCEYPYSVRWRPIACMLLSGKVRPTWDDPPNKTDVERVCKQANFDQYYFHSVASCLVCSDVVKSEMDRYKPGKHFEAFWGDDIEETRKAARHGLLRFVQRLVGIPTRRRGKVGSAELIEFLTLFFSCFQGRSLPSDQVGKVFLEFSRLPPQALATAEEGLGITARAAAKQDWSAWLDEKGQRALVGALYATHWANTFEHRKADWFFLNQTGRIMLGLETPPPPPRSLELKVLPNLCVFAGADLPVATLVPLFRYCKIKHIDRVVEFQLDKKAMVEYPSVTSAAEELRSALQGVKNLPDTVRSLIETEQRLGGVLKIRSCSGIVRPENSTVSAAIVAHPRLKGYIDRSGPPGYLLLKVGSDFYNFIARCRELGFQVESF